MKAKASGPLSVGETVKVCSGGHRLGEECAIVEHDKSDDTFRVKFADGERYWFQHGDLRRPAVAETKRWLAAIANAARRNI